jgi:hypothetical protein
MTQRAKILGADVTIQGNGLIMVENVQPSYATHGLPDPNIVGPCQSQSSLLCEPGNGRQRMDPMDMAETETAFRGYLQMCQPCYDSQADLFVRYTHGRD